MESPASVLWELFLTVKLLEQAVNSRLCGTAEVILQFNVGFFCDFKGTVEYF